MLAVFSAVFLYVSERKAHRKTLEFFSDDEEQFRKNVLNHYKKKTGSTRQFLDSTTCFYFDAIQMVTKPSVKEIYVQHGLTKWNVIVRKYDYDPSSENSSKSNT